MTRFQVLRSLSWSPTISMSWMWGLGFFYSMHVVWIQGWIGFWVFALTNACGLALFGCALNSDRRDPETMFEKLGPRFVTLFLLCQIGAVAITLFSLSAYLWPLLFSGADSAIGLALTALVLTVACATGNSLSLRKLRFLHVGYLAVGVAAIAIAWVYMPTAPIAQAKIDAPSTLSVWTFLLPTFVGFALGPWGDLQQWQRAIEIRRSGASSAVAYVGGALIFLVLLVGNAVLSRSAGMNLLVGTDGAIGAQSSVAARFAASGFGPGMVAYVMWAAFAALSTIDSFYSSTRWYLTLLLSKSLHPAFAFVPPSAASSPIWVLAVAVATAFAMSTFGLSQTTYMMPYATLLVGATVCMVIEVARGPVRFDPFTCYALGLIGAIVFFIGHREGIAALVPLSTAIALFGVARPLRATFFERSASSRRRTDAPRIDATDRKAANDAPASEPLPATATHSTPLTAHSGNLTPAHSFDGQWFVMQVTPTYDDTNSVGNVYFANYVRWVGKARELFFNACMPKFDLETTRYYVLTKSFEHDFRHEISEFEPAKVRLRIASHNRKFVTLGHEIVSERHGVLGRGEQSLMFVDRKSFKPLDIPVDIVRGFMPFWPSNRRASEAVSDGEDNRRAG